MCFSHTFAQSFLSPLHAPIAFPLHTLRHLYIGGTNHDCKLAQNSSFSFSLNLLSLSFLLVCSLTLPWATAWLKTKEQKEWLNHPVSSLPCTWCAAYVFTLNHSITFLWCTYWHIHLLLCWFHLHVHHEKGRSSRILWCHNLFLSSSTTPIFTPSHSMNFLYHFYWSAHCFFLDSIQTFFVTILYTETTHYS